MKQHKKYLLILLVPAFLASCYSTGTISMYSISYPSYESDAFDFNPIFGTKRKLAEYEMTRTFSTEQVGIFSGTLLNPQNYEESEDALVHYAGEESSSSEEPIDYSAESIAFGAHDAALSNLIDPLELGPLSSERVQALYDIIEHNDEVITHTENTYAETILYHGFLDSEYYTFNNYHKDETRALTRYDDPLIDGQGSGVVYYQDNFDEHYTFAEQIRANGFKIYEMRDETFPFGSTNANDYKITTNRVSGNFKEALILGGGGRFKRFVEEMKATYEPYTDPSHILFNENYRFELTAEKSEEETTMTFALNIDQHFEAEVKAVYETELHYVITIVDGVIVGSHSHQTTWAAL